MAQGLLIFHSIEAARCAGFSIYDRTADGYLARGTIDGRYALALVRIDTRQRPRA